MLGPEAEPDQPASEARERRPACHRAHEGGRTITVFHIAVVPPPVATHHQLQFLRQFRRQAAARLDGCQVRVGKPPVSQRLGEYVRRRNSILNREVHAEPADRGHGMHRVADAEQSRPLPAFQPVDAHCEKVHVLPGRLLLQACRVRSGRLGPCLDRRAEGEQVRDHHAQ
jgi:hypothetical protein